MIKNILKKILPPHYIEILKNSEINFLLLPKDKTSFQKYILLSINIH